MVPADPYAQLLAADGRILAASPRASTTPLLSAHEASEEPVWGETCLREGAVGS